MTILALIVVLVILGIVMYCINAFVPMDAQIKRILNIAVVLFLVIWLLQAFGLLDYLSNVRIGR